MLQETRCDYSHRGRLESLFNPLAIDVDVSVASEPADHIHLTRPEGAAKSARGGNHSASLGDVRLGDFVNGLLAEIRTGRGYDWRSVILVADDLLRRRTNKDCTLTDHKVTRLVLPVALESVAAEQTRRMADWHTVSLEMTLDGLSVVSLLPLAGLLVFQELHCQD